MDILSLDVFYAFVKITNAILFHFPLAYGPPIIDSRLLTDTLLLIPDNLVSSISIHIY